MATRTSSGCAERGAGGRVLTIPTGTDKRQSGRSRKAHDPSRDHRARAVEQVCAHHLVSGRSALICIESPQTLREAVRISGNIERCAGRDAGDRTIAGLATLRTAL